MYLLYVAKGISKNMATLTQFSILYSLLWFIRLPTVCQFYNTSYTTIGKLKYAFVPDFSSDITKHGLFAFIIVFYDKIFKSLLTLHCLVLCPDPTSKGGKELVNLGTILGPRWAFFMCQSDYRSVLVTWLTDVQRHVSNRPRSHIDQSDCRSVLIVVKSVRA